jgi:putative peptide zinc metalloprotease protein
VSTAPLKLRRDLDVSRQQTDEGSFWVVKDPLSGAFFRFREAEQFIVEQLDGATSLDVVRLRTEARFAASLPAKHLDGFVKRLKKAGLLDLGDAPRTERTGRRRRMRGSPLYLRCALFDPDRLLDRLVHRVRFLFTTKFVVLSGATMLLAAGIMIANWSELAPDLARLYRFSAIPLFVAVLFVIASLHEFAHALTCKRFGGQVHEMGFLLIYFQPALYTNVSDAWLFPDRRQRLWVGLAGPWFELFVWALAALAWRLTDAETRLHTLTVMVLAISGVKTLLNFNPLLKLDGYYLLSDYLDIPNLRKRSFAHVGALLKRLVGSGRGVVAEVSRREGRVYLLYGLLATVCSLGLLAFVAVQMGGFFIEAHQPVALAAFAGAAVIKSRRKLRKLFGKRSDPGASTRDGDDETPQPVDSAEPTGEKQTVRRGGPGKRRVAWAGVTAAALALVFLGTMELRIGGSFAVLPDENADVRAEVDGIVDDIPVDEGDTIRAGDVIARLSNHALVAELSKTEAAIRESRAFLQKLEVGPTAEEIAVVRAAIAKTEDRLRFAKGGVNRFTALFETASATRQEFEAAQELATTAENDLAEARGRLALQLRRSRPEDIEATTARLAALQTQQRFLEGEIRELTVTSPVSGIMATPSRQLREMEGQLVSRGALIAKVYALNTVTAQIVVSEKEIADVRVGQPVVLRVRAHPDVAFHGIVSAIATAADGSAASTAVTAPVGPATGAGTITGKTFAVTTRIENHALLLKPGMTGYAKILGGQRRIASLATRRLARTVKVEFWSWW